MVSRLLPGRGARLVAALHPCGHEDARQRSLHRFEGDTRLAQAAMGKSKVGRDDGGELRQGRKQRRVGGFVDRWRGDKDVLEAAPEIPDEIIHPFSIEESTGILVKRPCGHEPEIRPARPDHRFLEPHFSGKVIGEAGVPGRVETEVHGGVTEIGIDHQHAAPGVGENGRQMMDRLGRGITVIQTHSPAGRRRRRLRNSR